MTDPSPDGSLRFVAYDLATGAPVLSGADAEQILAFAAFPSKPLRRADYGRAYQATRGA